MAEWGYNAPYGDSTYKDIVAFSASPTVGVVDLTVFFNAPYYDPLLYNYLWYYSDTLDPTLFDATHTKDFYYNYTYTTIGKYTAKLIIEDLEHNIVVNETVEITVLPHGIYPYKTNKCFTCNTSSLNTENERNYEQGLGFSEYDGSWPMPESIVGSLVITDERDQKRYLIIDNNDGIFYDIGTKDAPSGYDIIRCNKDKESISMTNGIDIIPEVEFKEDTGEYEKFTTELLESRYYVKPLKEEYLESVGYGENGFLTNIHFTSSVKVDNTQLTDVASTYDILKNNAVIYDKKVEGNRIRSIFSSDKGDIQLTGRQHTYITKDIDYNIEETSTHQEQQLSLSSPLIWVTRGQNKELINNTDIICTNTTGPDGKENSAIKTSTQLTLLLPTTTSISGVYFWSKGTYIIELKKNGTWIDVTADLRYPLGTPILNNGWEAWKMERDGNQGIRITPTGDIELFDIRIYGYPNISGVEAYVNDILNNGGNNVCPIF